MMMISTALPRWAQRRFCLFCLAMASGLFVLPAASVGQIPSIPTPPPGHVVGAGHTAHWYDPERSGEGLALEILDEVRALVYWFTYDEEGNQRWLTGVGDIVSEDGDQWIEFPELIVTRGGEFGAGFDPEQVVREFAGQATIRFSGCDRGSWHYQAFGQEQTIALTRLSRTMGADCVAPIHGRPLMLLTDDAGLSGSWYDPARSGEGFSLQWLDRDEAVITWYTYDLEGNQQWILGLGRREGDQIVFPQLINTRGGRFGVEFDPEQVERLPWGQLVLDLGCNAGAMEYSALSEEFGEGGMNLSRLTRLERPDCPLTRPKLTDLYDLDLLHEIPITESGSNNLPVAMASDGTVVGRRPEQGRTRAWRWHPGEPEVEELPGRVEFNLVFMAPDAESIYAVQRFPEDGDLSSPEYVVVWRDGAGWQILPGTFLPRPVLRGISRNGEYLVGRARQVDDDTRSVLWTWNADHGQQIITVQDEFTFDFSGISDDGRIVFGIRTDLGGPSFFPRRDRATRWVDGEAEFLQDEFGAWLAFPFGCAAECRIIYGRGQSVDVDPGHPHLNQAWFWTEDRGAEYVDMLPGARENGTSSLSRASEDGSLMTGSFGIDRPNGGRGARGFVWTRATGSQPLVDILDAIGVSDAAWDATAVSVISPDGRRLLVVMQRFNLFSSLPGSVWAGVVELTPRRKPHE